MPRRKAIQRDFVVDYWHFDEDYHDPRQAKIIRLLAQEEDFNDTFVISNVCEEPNLVQSQLDY